MTNLTFSVRSRTKNTRIRHFLGEETERNSGNQIMLQVKRVKMRIEL